MPHEADHQEIEGAAAQKLNDGRNRMPGQQMGFERYTLPAGKLLGMLDDRREAEASFLFFLFDLVDRRGKARDLLNTDHVQFAAALERQIDRGGKGRLPAGRSVIRNKDLPKHWLLLQANRLRGRASRATSQTKIGNAAACNNAEARTTAEIERSYNTPSRTLPANQATP